MITKRSVFPWPWTWALFFLFFWQVLLRAQNPGLMSDDSGEMAAASYRLGLPHPPGYPLLCLLGRLATLFPVGTIAFRLNLLSELLALLSLWFVLDAGRHWAMRYWPKGQPFLFLEFSLLLAALGLIGNRSLFSQCLTAKGGVYTLSLLLTSLVLWSVIKFGTDRKILFVSFFAWGLGLANHWPTQVLWVPFLGLLVWEGVRSRGAKPLIFLLTLSLIGSSLYLYLPLRTAFNPVPCWGNPVRLGGFLWVITRKLVTGWEPWIQSPGFYVDTLKEFGRITFESWPPWSLFLGLAGFYSLWKKDKGLLVKLLVLFVPIVAAVFAIHEEQNIYLVHVYLLSLYGIVALLILAGILEIVLWKSGLGRWWALPFLGVMVLLSGSWMAHSYRVEDRSRYTLAEDFGTNVLKALPQGALFLADGDHYVMPIWYARAARGQRPDLIFEPSVFLYHGWGWKQLILQSPDLEPLILTTDTFVGRMTALADRDERHPFFYSLGTRYLRPVLTQVPGFLEPWGLTYWWRNGKAGKNGKPWGPRWLEAQERTRGLSDWGEREEVDLSTAMIFRYYAQQRLQEGPEMGE